MDAKNGLTIRGAETRDICAIANIYNHFIETSIITFEEERVEAAEIARRLDEIQSAPLPWLVAVASGQIVGYAYATHWKTRSAYRFSVEIAIYLAPGSGGRGIGSELYRCLLPDLQALGIHAVIGGIALPNQASVALHEKFRFKKVAHFKEVGFKFGRWIDVGYWQRTL